MSDRRVWAALYNYFILRVFLYLACLFIFDLCLRHVEIHPPMSLSIPFCRTLNNNPWFIGLPWFIGSLSRSIPTGTHTPTLLVKHPHPTRIERETQTEVSLSILIGIRIVQVTSNFRVSVFRTSIKLLPYKQIFFCFSVKSSIKSIYTNY